MNSQERICGEAPIMMATYLIPIKQCVLLMSSSSIVDGLEEIGSIAVQVIGTQEGRERLREDIQEPLRRDGCRSSLHMSPGANDLASKYQVGS